jgi:hypothetical protein
MAAGGTIRNIVALPAGRKPGKTPALLKHFICHAGFEERNDCFLTLPGQNRDLLTLPSRM